MEAAKVWRKARTPELITKDDSFQILQKVEDMIDYAYPLIKRWSVADKYA